jgi:hypothetical protein
MEYFLNMSGNVFEASSPTDLVQKMGRFNAWTRNMDTTEYMNFVSQEMKESLNLNVDASDAKSFVKSMIKVGGLKKLSQAQLNKYRKNK